MSAPVGVRLCGRRRRGSYGGDGDGGGDDDVGGAGLAWRRAAASSSSRMSSGGDKSLPIPTAALSLAQYTGEVHAAGFERGLVGKHGEVPSQELKGAVALLQV